MARGTGQEVWWDDAAIVIDHRFVTNTAEQGRGMGLFADPVPVPRTCRCSTGRCG